MVEPFSLAVGAVGLTTGLLGFVLSTVERAAVTYRALTGCEWYLNNHQSTLVICKKRLERWHKRWRPLLEADTYEGIWGVEGWRDVQKILRNVARQDQEIRRLLFSNTHPDQVRDRNSFSTTWSAFVEHGTARIFSADAARNLKELLGEVIPRADDFDAAFQVISRDIAAVPRLRAFDPGRVSFAAYKSTILEKEIQALKQQVENLEQVSDLQFKEEQDVDDGDSRSNDEILRTKQHAESLWNTMSTLWSELDMTEGVWALLMTPTENPQCCQLESDSIDLHFLHAPERFAQGASGRRVTMKYYYEDKETDSVVANVIQELEAEDPPETRAELDRTLRSTFLALILYYEEADELLARKAIAMKCATAALCVTLWASLLAWQSSWIDDLCNCGIRFACFQGSNDLPSFLRQQQHRGRSCFESRILERPHLLLGLVLAEIGMAQPLNVRFERSNIMFEIQFGLNSYESVPETELLTRVRKATNKSPFFASAVRQCFEWDRMDGGRIKFKAQHVKRYAAKVVSPLHKHFSIMEEQERKRTKFNQTVRARAQALQERAARNIDL